MKLDGETRSQAAPFLRSGVLIGVASLYLLFTLARKESYGIDWISPWWLCGAAFGILLYEVIDLIFSHKTRVASFAVDGQKVYGRIIEGKVELHRFQVKVATFWWTYPHGWPVNAKRRAPSYVAESPRSSEGGGGAGANSLELYFRLETEEGECFVFREELAVWNNQPRDWVYRPERYTADDREFITIGLRELVDWIRPFKQPTQGCTLEFS